MFALFYFSYLALCFKTGSRLAQCMRQARAILTAFIASVRIGYVGWGRSGVGGEGPHQGSDRHRLVGEYKVVNDGKNAYPCRHRDDAHGRVRSGSGGGFGGFSVCFVESYRGIARRCVPIVACVVGLCPIGNASFVNPHLMSLLP